MAIKCVVYPALAAAVIALLPCEAKSQVIPLDVPGGTRLQFDIPPGYCELRASRSATEKRFWSFLDRSHEGSGFKPLGHVIDCAAYASLDTPEYSLNSWISVVVPVDATGAVITVPGITRQEMLRARTSSATQEDIKAKTGKGIPNVVSAAKEIGVDYGADISHLGIVATDGSGIYNGFLTRASRNGVPLTYAGVETTTFVANHVVLINAYMMGDSRETLSKLTNLSRVLARDFVSDNGPWISLSFVVSSIAVAGIATAFAALLSIAQKRSWRRG